MKHLLLFLLLFLSWILWSGKFDAFHLSFGAASCALVTAWSRGSFFPGERPLRLARFPARFLRFAAYLPWLLYQILLSNIHVAWLVLHPNMPIQPHLVRFRSRLKKDVSLTTLANSITLTPGTITADVSDGEFLVHCISKKTAEDLLAGDMEARVARIFGEE